MANVLARRPRAGRKETLLLPLAFEFEPDEEEDWDDDDEDWDDEDFDEDDEDWEDEWDEEEEWDEEVA